MQGSSRQSEADAAGQEAWILFWASLLVLAALAVLGAAFASADAVPGDYVCGLVLSLGSILLAFLHIKARFDGAAAGWAGSLFVDAMPSLVVALVLFVALALAGLFVAAAYPSGGLHNAGVALFAVSALWVLLSLKHVFDRVERGR